MIDNTSIGFIGSGKMAEALIKGIVESKIVPSRKVICSDISEERLDFIKSSYNVSTADSEQVCSHASVIFLCVKPQQMKDVLSGLRSFISSDKLIVSIAAGISIDFLKENLNEGVGVVRTMPNTPCQIGKGMTALAPSQDVSSGQLDIAKQIFESVGKSLITIEDKINAITGISGSGPAFLYEIAEQFARSGEANGLSYDDALMLIAQTMIGAAGMIQQTGDTTHQLIKNVSSPGGTTVAGLGVLQNGELAKIISSTVSAAVHRAEELSKG